MGIVGGLAEVQKLTRLRKTVANTASCCIFYSGSVLTTIDWPICDGSLDMKLALVLDVVRNER